MVAISRELAEREKEVHDNIEEYAELFELDPDLIRAIISQESRFIGNAVSPTKCYGFGQFTNIGAKQVQLIAAMTPKAADLANFQKSEASDPDRGIKAICAFIWWLFYKKYSNIQDKRLKLECALTFYNAGGRAAAIVQNAGSHAAAVPALRALPAPIRSQSDKYAAGVSMWYVAWHEYSKQLREQLKREASDPVDTKNPFEEKEGKLDPRYRVLVEAIRLMDDADTHVECTISSRDGFTEIILILPGEY